MSEPNYDGFDRNNPIVRMALREIDDAENTMRATDFEPYQKILLPEFEQKILPLIVRGECTESDIRAWLEVTRHGYVGLDVIDADGNTKYLIPALLTVGYTNPKAIRYADTLPQMRSLYSESPLAGAGFFLQVLESLDDKVTNVSSLRLDLLKVMNQILVDYGHEPISNLLGNANDTNKATAAEPQIIGYDDSI